MACFYDEVGARGCRVILRVCQLRSAQVSQSSAKTVIEQAVSVAMFLLIRANAKEAFVTEVVGLGCGGSPQANLVAECLRVRVTNDAMSCKL